MVKPHLPTANTLLNALPSADLAALRVHAIEVDLILERVLHEAGTTIESVYFPYGGLVSLLVVMPSGQVAESGFVGSDGVVGTGYNFAARISFTRTKVVAPGRALRLPLSLFETAARRSGPFRDLIIQNNNRLTAAAQQIAACHLLHQLEPRLCRWLLQVFDHSESSEISITQDDLAHMLGVNRSRLNEALKTLQNLDAISQSQRGKLKIVDAGLIAERVCDCHRTLRALERDDRTVLPGEHK